MLRSLVSSLVLHSFSETLCDELVPTTLVEFPSTRTVEADITVNGFDADARFPFAQHPTSDLLGQPLLVDHQCDDFLLRLRQTMYFFYFLLFAGALQALKFLFCYLQKLCKH